MRRACTARPGGRGADRAPGRRSRVALAGSLGDGSRLHDAGIDAAFSLAPGPISLEQACAGAAAELEARAEQIARLWRLAQLREKGSAAARSSQAGRAASPCGLGFGQSL